MKCENKFLTEISSNYLCIINMSTLLKFLQEREDFRRKYVETANSNAADELSKFYKDFLDRNWKTHCRYNIDWYKKNIYLSSLALRVNVGRLLRYCKLF